MGTPYRELLFGLTALQVGLIDHEQLVEALRAWSQDKQRTMSEVLVALDLLSRNDCAAIDSLVARHAKRYGGDIERSLASLPIGDMTRDYVVNVGDRQLTQTIQHLPRRSHESGIDRTASLSVGSASVDGLRFRVLRPHARGGLGTVSVALDAELHREVALKEILDRHSDNPISRQRFLLEAEITGGLEHPGIVPVYGLGAYSNGRPYYAMRFIRGDSLGAAIQQFHADDALLLEPGRRSLELRNLLKRFTDVCNAIEYAHTRGVLHRDIKPGNIIVGKYGETLVVDWGLAKRQSQDNSDERVAEQTLHDTIAPTDGSETMPGSVLGTPAYMSPEQASGNLDALGPWSDVYSLGATLYCLLTGKAPFRGDDLGTMLEAVQQGEFPRPQQVSPKVDAALEAICLKAMATAPEDRYPSARALADDVDRWLADEPVKAYPEPWTRKVSRWVLRHRTAVTAATAAGLVAILGLSALAAVQTRSRNLLSAKNSELKEANESILNANADLEVANDQVKARYRLAVEAIKTFHSGVSEDFLLKEEQFHDLRDELLSSASDFYQKLAATLESEEDLDSRQALLQANFEVAELANKVGRKDDALELHRRVLSSREAMTGESATSTQFNEDVAQSRLAIGRILESTGKNEEALAEYELARSAGSATGYSPSGQVALMLTAEIDKSIGRVLQTMGRFNEAQPMLKKSLDQLAILAAAEPENEQLQADLAQSYEYEGILLLRTAAAAESIESFDAALAILQNLVDKHPDSEAYKNSLAKIYDNKCVVLSRIGEMPAATAALATSLEIRRQLAENNPAVTQFQARLATAYNNLGATHGRQGNLTEALKAFEQSAAVRQQLVDNYPATTSFQFDLSRSYFNIGVVRDDSGMHKEALDAYETALEIRRQLADNYPDVIEYQVSLAQTYTNVGSKYSDAGRRNDSLAAHRLAMEIQTALVAAHSTVPSYQNDLAISHLNIGTLQFDAGELEEALASYHASLEIRLPLAETNEDVTDYRSRLAGVHTRIGLTCAAMDRHTEAIQAHDAALAIHQKLADANPTIPEMRNQVASSQTNIADVMRALGRRNEARTAYDKAITLRDALVRDQPDIAIFRSYLGYSLRRRGLNEYSDEQFKRAADDTQQALEMLEALPSRTGSDWFETACCHATLSVLAGRAASGVAEENGPGHADQAISLLRKSLELGFKRRDAYFREDALEALRQRNDFKSLTVEIESNER